MSVKAAFLVTGSWEAGGVSAAPRTPGVRQSALRVSVAGSWEAGGVSAAPRTPGVRQGAGAVYGSESYSAAVGRHEEKEPQKRERLFPLFCGKTHSRFCSTSPLAERKLCCAAMIG